jgi:hypothetical protein
MGGPPTVTFRDGWRAHPSQAGTTHDDGHLAGGRDVAAISTVKQYLVEAATASTIGSCHRLPADENRVVEERSSSLQW